MNEMDFQQPQEVDAQVLDQDLMISSKSFEVDMSGIQRDIEDLTIAIDEALTVYGDLLVDPNAIERMSYTEARRCERNISAAIREADECRKRLNRDYRTPLDVAKRRYDELMEPALELHGLFKARRIALDKEKRNAKKLTIKELYERVAAPIALPLDGFDEAFVPFERIFERYGSSWLNKSATLDSVELELDGIVSRIMRDERRIDEAGLRHAAGAKSEYWRTLDVEAAFGLDRQLCQAEQRQTALEAARLAHKQAALGRADSPDSGSDTARNSNPVPAAPSAATFETPSPDAATSELAVPDAAAALEPSEPTANLGTSESSLRKPRVMLIDGATDEECRQIGAFCKSLGISGVFKGPCFYESVKSITA